MTEEKKEKGRRREWGEGQRREERRRLR